MFYGTDYTGSRSLDVWEAAGSSHTPDQATTWYTAGASTWEMTGLQVEVNSFATDFEHKSFAQELQLCKRYFQKMTRVSQELFCSGYFESDTIGRHALPLPITMRTDPSVTFSAASTFTNVYTGSLQAGTSVGTINVNPECIFTTLTVGSGGGVDGQACLLSAQHSQTATISMDAEL